MSKNNNLLKLFGINIKQKRLCDGISAKALSDSVNISRATLSAVENGNGNVSIKTYLDLADILGIKISFNLDKPDYTKRQRSPKRLTKETIKRNQFEVFCIEKYANHIKSVSNNVYSLFKNEGLLNILRTDFEDLHGMSIEYLMQFFDSYLEKTSL